tara:strand:+ start:392 stop:679 length:288 start_codon:yes stop_codon:yes gene_type:complete
VGINAHTWSVKMSYLDLPYFSISLDIVNPVTNTDEINAIIIVCSNVKPISNIVSAILPDTNGEKNDTPKLPNILAEAFLTFFDTIINRYIVKYIN